MRIQSRRRLIACLVLVFFVQTWLVYADPAGRANGPLSEEASRGREIWHENNCQSCHQLYGFGGFLGPDLTNATETLTAARLEAVLTVGAKQMPAFDLDAGEREAIEAFLAEVHATGRGQLPPRRSFDAEEVLVRSVDGVVEAGSPLSPAELRGLAVMREQKCIGCHLPNPASDKKGTDLTALIGKLGPGGVKAILAAGVPAKGMPRFDLEAEDDEALISFLEWMAANAGPVHQTFLDAAPKEGESDGLPWFEYE